MYTSLHVGTLVKILHCILARSSTPTKGGFLSPNIALTSQNRCVIEYCIKQQRLYHIYAVVLLYMYRMADDDDVDSAIRHRHDRHFNLSQLWNRRRRSFDVDEGIRRRKKEGRGNRA